MYKCFLFFFLQKSNSLGVSEGKYIFGSMVTLVFNGMSVVLPKCPN